MSEAVNDARTFARNAKGVRELLSMKFDTLPFEGEWYDAFGTPESRGVWKVRQRENLFCNEALQGIVQIWSCSLQQFGGRYQPDHAEYRTT